MIGVRLSILESAGLELQHRPEMVSDDRYVRPLPVYAVVWHRLYLKHRLQHISIRFIWAPYEAKSSFQRTQRSVRDDRLWGLYLQIPVHSRQCTNHSDYIFCAARLHAWTRGRVTNMLTTHFCGPERRLFFSHIGLKTIIKIENVLFANVFVHYAWLMNLFLSPVRPLYKL